MSISITRDYDHYESCPAYKDYNNFDICECWQKPVVELEAKLQEQLDTNEKLSKMPPNSGLKGCFHHGRAPFACVPRDEPCFVCALCDAITALSRKVSKR